MTRSGQPGFDEPKRLRVDVEFGLDPEWQHPLRVRMAERKVGDERQVGPTELLGDDGPDRSLEGGLLLR